MPPFIITNINAIVSDCFRDYYEDCNPACVLRDVVPILWFGDMDAYWKSEKKIVTVAVNPSYKEFQDDKGRSSIGYRFPGAPANYDSHNPQHFEAYMNAMNRYFKNKPYKDWFWFNEKVLHLFDASYQGVFWKYKNDSGKKFRNTALHIDLKAPVATYPVWGDKELAPRERKAVVKLYAKYFDSMWHYLDPDMMIVSTSAQNVKEAFGINYGNVVIHRTSKRGYVDLHVIASPVSGKRVNIVWGLNHGTPFSGSGMTYEFICESCCAIRQEIQSQNIIAMQRYLSQHQSNALDSLKKALSGYKEVTCNGSVMRDVLDSVVYRYEDIGFRTFNVNDLQKRKKDLQERYDKLRKIMQESEIIDIRDKDRIIKLDSELTAIDKQKRSIEDLIDRDGKEMLLGTYHYDKQTNKGVITLYLDNINDASKVLPKRFGSNAGVYLLQYVFVHEAFHAYFDMCHNDKIQEIEEAMAEYASLCFLSGYDKDVFSLAEYEINEKKNSPIWTSAYGFGEYLYHAWKPDFINDYRSVNQQINPVLSRVKKYVTMFSAGYPFGEEAKCIKLLYQILYGKKNLPIPVAQPKQSGIVTQVRDYTKYHFNGKTYCKRRLVLAVIKEYAKQHPIDDVKDRFDPVKNGSRVVVKKYSKLSPTRPDDSKRYFIEANDRVLDCNTKEEYVVDNQWGRGDEFDNFLKVAKNLGYKIR